MRIVPLAVLLGFGCSSESPQSSRSAPQTAGAAEVAAVGRPAPEFELADQDGQTHRLSSLRGKVVVLEWTNPECPFVKRHYDAGTMTRAQAAMPADRVVWLAIDSSHHLTAETDKAWRAERRIPWPILQDRDGRVGHAYGARTTPHLFVIDAEGMLRYAGGIDDDPHDEKATDTVYAASAVEALLAGRAPSISTAETYGCSVKYDD